MMEHNVLVIMVICSTAAALMLGAVEGFGPRNPICDKTPKDLKTKFDGSCIAKVGVPKCKSLWAAFSEAFAFKDSTEVRPE